jgi:membrane protease YdiL (CAAX protease family)
VLLVWILITLVGGYLLSPRGVRLDALVSREILWPVVAAAAFVVAVGRATAWPDLALRPPQPGTLRALWFPVLYVLVFLSLAMSLGLPTVRVLGLVAANTLVVGLSEEVMFRGLLYPALRRRLRIWPAILLTSALFGAVHVLNVVTTGALAASALQAVAAAMSGLVFLALRLRTGSLWPAILYHAAWDFGTFVMVIAATGSGGGGAPPTGPAVMLVPLAIVVPNALYALWLLRAAARTRPPGDPPDGLR